jgi:hypothetical protein
MPEATSLQKAPELPVSNALYGSLTARSDMGVESGLSGIGCKTAEANIHHFLHWGWKRTGSFWNRDDAGGHPNVTWIWPHAVAVIFGWNGPFP